MTWARSKSRPPSSAKKVSDTFLVECKEWEVWGRCPWGCLLATQVACFCGFAKKVSDTFFWGRGGKCP